MQFKDIPGHEDVKARLCQMADSGKIPHALLIHGPQGTGKMQLARAFAQYIGCRHRSGGDSCGVCPECRQNDSLNNPDLHFIYPVIKGGRKYVYSTDYAEEWKEMLSEHPWMEPEEWPPLIKAENSQPTIFTEESGEISRIAALSSYSSDYKIFIIWQPEKMKTEAANKLLKLLEEPFSDTLFILVSNNSEAILPTIFSRVQRIEAGRLSDAEVADFLMKKGFSPEEASRVAALSGGRPGIALPMASSTGESKEFGDAFRESMRTAYAMKGDGLKDLSEKYAGMGREKGMRLLRYFSVQVRENFIYNLGVAALNVQNREEEEFSRRFAPFIHAGNVEQISEEIDKAITDIGRNANSKIVWFDFLLQLMVRLRTPRP